MIKEKHTGKLLCLLLPVIILMTIILSAFSLSARAVSVDELDTLESPEDIVISVVYDKEKPDVTFISPSDKRYSSDEDFDDVKTGENALYFFISNAQAGTWMIEYDKKSNSKLDVGVATWHKPIKLNSFTFRSEKEDRYDLPFVKGTVNADYSGGSYSYYLYAVKFDDKGEIKNKYVISGALHGRSNDDCEFSVYPDMIPDGEYYIMVDVYAEDSTGLEVHDMAVATGKYVMTGNTLTGNNDCLSIKCVINDETIYYSFDPSKTDTKCEEYGIIVDQAGSSEHLQLDTFENSLYEDSIIFDPAQGDVTITVNGKIRSGKFVTWTKKFSVKMPLDLKLESPEVTNSTTAVFSFDAGSEKYPGTVILNGSPQSVQFSGSNKVQITVEPMQENELEVIVTHNDVKYSNKYNISVDTLPPMIDLFGASGDMTTTNKSVVFVGKTEASAKFTCNGSEVTLDDSGAFSITQDIKDGENVFLFEAQDIAGNVASRSIRVTKGNVSSGTKLGSGSSKSGILGVLATIGSVLGMALALLIAGVVSDKRCAKAGIPSKPYKAVGVTFAAIAAAASLGTGVYQLVQHSRGKDRISGSELIDLVKNSTTAEIAQMIRNNTSHLYNSFICFGAALVIILITAAFIIIGHIRKKKKRSKAAAPVQK